MMFEFRRILSIVVVTALAQLVFAEARADATRGAPVALIADEISYSSETGVVTARGDVQVFRDGRTLTADEISYDSNADRLRAAGAMVLRTESGETVFADAADLDAEFRNGIIDGAKAVIAGGAAKFAAAEAERVEDRYNVLTKAVFSPCEVCAASPSPLWRIRAERIIHDQEERRIHYEDAYFDVLGATVGYLPYFSHPSPEVDRATGFLAPDISNDGAYGFGVKLPYYIVVDDYSDVTLTPFVATNDGAILETEYRRRFATGFIDLDLNLGVTDYDSDGKDARARFGGFGTARYGLGDGVHTGFDLAFATDDPFLRRYEYTDLDRLNSEAFIRAYDGRNRAGLNLSYTQSLRRNEPQDTLPAPVPEFSLRRVMNTPFVGGGELGFSLDGGALFREEGRDAGRISAGADWSRSVITEGGLVLRGFADARGDAYQTGDDPALDGAAYRFLPRAGVEARMPFMRSEETGATQILEPIVQFIATPGDINQGDIPNEDSVEVEFDEMNLFETDRFTGFDRVETGVFANIGARFTRIDPAGWGATAAGGAVIRFTDQDEFSSAAGLTGATSDFVGSLGLTYSDQLQFGARARISDEFEFNRAEIYGVGRHAPVSLYGSLLYIEADPSALSFDERSEAMLGGALDLNRNWRLAGEVGRDLESDRFNTARASVTYTNECAAVEVYANRNFNETEDVPDSLTVGLRVRLFGATDDYRRRSRVCDYRTSQ
ncbi:LPS-assembly protein LptD [Pikeienuella piscinae]|uniref:LPS-assembly protein LptD n=1 Tax=Pikeienuella piscinae TaxID=2748098 RepID=A0A7L5BTJ1_9RHOB|nr:LPS assembly protein LptD [Pikeienuella piscinae]QIE55360.1 LPS-assembly protein LptD [Pikeienuella piscinae]